VHQNARLEDLMILPLAIVVFDDRGPKGIVLGRPDIGNAICHDILGIERHLYSS